MSECTGDRSPASCKDFHKKLALLLRWGDGLHISQAFIPSGRRGESGPRVVRWVRGLDLDSRRVGAQFRCRAGVNPLNPRSPPPTTPNFA